MVNHLQIPTCLRCLPPQVIAVCNHKHWIFLFLCLIHNNFQFFGTLAVIHHSNPKSGNGKKLSVLVFQIHQQEVRMIVFHRRNHRIIHCKSFRRLKHKPQVFLQPEGDHYRTRLTHTLEVSQIARTISRALRLNEDLTEAIALGHDLGHTPFGHAGERALNRFCPGGFSHYRQSLRVVDYLERDGQGLDLTWEVRNGIVTHTSGAWARTPEGCVVRRADHIAFLNHDIEDAITAGVLDARQLPPEAVAVLGHTKSERITTMITDLVAHSGNGKINFSPEVEAAYAVLKDFMYATVYVDKEAKREEKKVDKLISELYDLEVEVNSLYGDKVRVCVPVREIERQ